jgi:hypothetical protein
MDKDTINNMAVVAVWKKTKRAKTIYMTVFNTASVDQVNTTRARKPIIPNDAPMLELGVGKSFINQWMVKYKLKKYNVHP